MYIGGDTSIGSHSLFVVAAVVVIFVIKEMMRNRAEKKVAAEISNRGGRLISIDEESHREMIYVVKYEIDGEIKTQIVRYSLGGGVSWY